MVVVLSVISDTYEQFDALTACFPWCTTTTARCIPRGSRCKRKCRVFHVHVFVD